MLRPYYRTYDLPWSPDLEDEARFRKLWRTLLAVCLVLGLLIWLIDLPEPPPNLAPSIPPRLAKIVIEREIPPPPPPPPPEPQRPQEQVQPRESPKPAEQPRPQDARQRAARAGLLAFQDELADLRDQFDLTREQLRQAQQNASGSAEPPSSTRSVITSKVGRASGGISMAGQSRGFGAGAGSLGEHTTTQVAVPFAGQDGAREGVRRSGSSGKASRTREEIELVFDRNKGAIYALYSRALRERPDLQGKMVLEFTIAPSGEVTMCRVVSSELNDPELERKIVARVRMFRFEAKDVEPVTTTKPIDFFPA